MSKPILRIVIVVVGLIVLAGIFATVQAAASTAGMMNGKQFLTAGLLPDQTHVRQAKTQAQPYFMPDGGDHEGGGCERDGVDSSDF